MPTTKTCTKCGETKPLDGFHKHKGRRDGFVSQCKTCISNYGRRYREANRDDIAERKRRYRAENRDDISEYQRRYREGTRYDMSEYQRRYREENRDLLNVKLSKYQRETQELTEVFATVPKRAPWMPEEVTFLLADNGMTTYEKAVKLGRTYDSCNGKLGKLRKKLGVSPGDH